jgi:beta-glucosidase
VDSAIKKSIFLDTKRHIDQRVEDLLKQMTLQEKIAQLGSAWFSELMADGQLSRTNASRLLANGLGQVTRIAGVSALPPTDCARMANAIQHYLVDETRLGIPAIVHEECCSGLMGLGGTTFPQIIGLASTWEPELAEKMATVIRAQMRAMGAHQGLAPVLDVGRDPRWGRIEETFGEDPVLVSQFGMAYVRGLQGSSLKSGVMATGKHFVGYSQSQGGLNCAPVSMGPRELWDVYLMPFQAVIQRAGLATIMNAYPELDGELVAASRRILTNLLREQLGFDGLLVSDYYAIGMIFNFHHVAPDLAGAVRLALNAGIDVETPGRDGYGEPLLAAIAKGEIPIDQVDCAVRRHLRKKFELGLFENPYVDEGRVPEIFETAEQRSLARQIALQSMVLLKNDGTLPLKESTGKLAVIGPNADSSRNLMGDYSYTAMLDLLRYSPPVGSSFADIDVATLAPHAVKAPTILESIQAAHPQIKLLYARGCDNLDADASGIPAAVAAAKQAEAVLLVLGDRSGMTPACTTGELRDSADLRLPGVQEKLAEAILDTGKPVVLVLVNGRPLAIPDLVGRANAVLEAWLPGEEGGPAVSEVLFGDANPGGKLPMTFPHSVGQLPVFYNHKPAGGHSHWYVDYVGETVEPLYPFGHGLSYTTFEYSDLSLARPTAWAGERVSISLVVRNTGPVAGDEVVQLYVCDEYASTTRPVKELKGYARLCLQPGQAQTVTFHLPVNMLAFYNERMELVVEAGKIKVMAGSSSADIRLQSSFEIIGPAKQPVKERVFICPVELR